MQKDLLNDTYEIREELGSGGGGTVYKAYHRRLQCDVVVKKIKDEVKGRLDNRAEVDILKKLKHTYLPQVYDFLEIEGDIYTVMDFVSGSSLSEEIKHGRKFTQKEVVKWGTQLCEALDYLHTQTPPIIHSDIKPANIMLTPEGNIALIDFNISMALDQDMSASVGISKGYSPPEQYKDSKSYLESVSHYYTHDHAKFKVVFEEEKGTEVLEESEETAAVIALDETEVLVETEVPGKAGSSVQTTEILNKTVMQDTEILYETEILSETALGRQDNADISKYTQTRELIEHIVGVGIDKRSDIYSLSATLYHLISGRHPNPAYEEVIPIEKLSLPISDALEYIISKGMQFDPAMRYQQVGKMFSDFKNIKHLDGRYKQYKRKKNAAIAGFIVGYILFSGIAVYGYTETVREKNNSFVACISEANSNTMDGSFEEAQQSIDLAREIYPERIDSYLEELLIFYKKGEYEECIRYGEGLLNMPPYKIRSDSEEAKKADILFVTGNGYFALESYADAIRYFQWAIESNTGNSEYYRDYAISLARTGQIERAGEVLAEAIRKGLGEDSIYIVQGEIALMEKDIANAEACLTSAIRTAQTTELKQRAYVLLAKMYKGIGGEFIDDEIKLLEEAEAELSGGNPLVIIEIQGDAYARKARLVTTGKTEYYSSALGKFESLYDGGYTTFNVMQNIAIIYEEINDFSQARDMLETMREKYPDNYKVYVRLAFLEADEQQRIANEKRNYDQFVKYYSQANEMYQKRSNDGNSDPEMQMLDVMMRDLKSGGWL